MTEKCKKLYSKLKDIDEPDKIKELVKDIKSDQKVAEELWAIRDYLPRLLAILLFDIKSLNQTFIEQLARDSQVHPANERDKLLDWLLLYKLTRSKKSVKLVNSWENSDFPLLRMLFWYNQGRLRWTDGENPDNSFNLLNDIEKKILDEPPEVQWAMNYCCAQIGIYEDRNTDYCIKLGKKLGLYKRDWVAKGATPNYLPNFIKIERAILGKK